MAVSKTKLEILKSERGKALSCYERSLFFANSFPSERASSFVPITQQEYSANISLIYVVAWQILRDRLRRTIERYIELRNALKSETLADREVPALFKSGGAVGRSFDSIAQDVMEMGKLSVLPVNEMVANWKGLNNLCRLLMEEISHLSARVESLNGTQKTVQSIRYGVWGIGIGAAFSLISLCISLSGRQSNGFGSEFFFEIGKAKGELAALDQSLDSKQCVGPPSTKTLKSTTHQ